MNPSISSHVPVILHSGFTRKLATSPKMKTQSCLASMRAVRRLQYPASFMGWWSENRRSWSSPDARRRMVASATCSFVIACILIVWMLRCCVAALLRCCVAALLCCTLSPWASNYCRLNPHDKPTRVTIWLVNESAGFSSGFYYGF